MLYRPHHKFNAHYFIQIQRHRDRARVFDVQLPQPRLAPVTERRPPARHSRGVSRVPSLKERHLPQPRLVHPQRPPRALSIAFTRASVLERAHAREQILIPRRRRPSVAFTSRIVPVRVRRARRSTDVRRRRHRGREKRARARDGRRRRAEDGHPSPSRSAANDRQRSKPKGSKS